MTYQYINGRLAVGRVITARDKAAIALYRANGPKQGTNVPKFPNREHKLPYGTKVNCYA